MEAIKPKGFRKIIDPEGTFQLFIPPTWRYWVMDGDVHSFEDNEIGGDADCFQLSLSLLTEAERMEMAAALGYLLPNKMGDFDCRSYPDVADDKGYTTKAWSTIYGFYHVYLTFTYKNCFAVELSNKLELVYSVFATFDILPEEHKEQLVTSHRFEVFLQGMGATNLLVKKAIENKAFFEATCLFGNQIDSLLRIGILLKQQLLNKNDVIEREWIYQGLSDKKKSEKDVYKKALAIGVIDDDLYADLFELYEDRNRVIHRFIISEITLAEVEHIAYDYYYLREGIKIIVDNLETEQINLNIGMTTTDETDPGNRSPNLFEILGKIGKVSYFESEETSKI